jgi:uncharacterized protein YndB with AHSA1/START domain
MTQVNEVTTAAIVHLLKIEASPERVYQAVSTAEGIEHWWTRDASLEAKVGGHGEFGFYDRRFIAKVQVTELEPPSRVGWRVDGPPWAGTTISFDIRTDGDGVTLKFAHRGHKEADDNVARASTRWAYYLISLKSYLEKGQGTPNPDDADF